MAVKPARPVLERGLAAYRHVRFRLWAARLGLELRLRGARLVLDAPHGARLDAPLHLKLVNRGEGGRTLTLRFGRDVHFGRNVQLEVWVGGTNELAVGDGAYVLDGVRLSLRGGRIDLGPLANVRDYAVLKSQGELIVGRHVAISYGDVLHCTERLELADLVGMAERVTIIDSEKSVDGSDTHFLAQPLRVAPVRIERNVFVAAGAVITLGSHVGENAVIAAGAVLTGGEYPARWIIGGAPARPLRELGAQEGTSSR